MVFLYFALILAQTDTHRHSVFVFCFCKFILSESVSFSAPMFSRNDRDIHSDRMRAIYFARERTKELWNSKQINQRGMENSLDDMYILLVFSAIFIWFVYITVTDGMYHISYMFAHFVYSLCAAWTSGSNTRLTVTINKSYFTLYFTWANVAKELETVNRR